MGNSSEVEVSRNEEVSMADSTVELYLDKTVLDLTIEEYETLKGTLLDWADQIGANIEKVQDASSGEASYAIAKQGGAYLDEDFTELLTKTDVALNTMNLTSFRAHRLLLRCENFYEILQGESEYMGDYCAGAGAALFSGGLGGMENAIPKTPMTSELYLDTTFYGDGGGVLSTTTDDAVLQFTNIDSLKNTVERYLSSLEVGQIDVSAECEAIQDDCDKKDRLDTLYDSFVKYVLGVNALNTSATDSFGDIAQQRYMFDFTRTYTYPDYKGTEQNTVLQRALRAELHEMGITDEEIEAATTKSSFSLASLTAAVESMAAEQHLERNDNKEIALFKCVLSGDSLNGYNSYGHSLADKAQNCWYYVATYQMGLVHTEYKAGKHQFSDDGYNNYIDEMNAVFMSLHSDEVLSALKTGGYQVVVKSSAEYVDAMSTNNTYAANALYENYRKNLLLYDAYIGITEKIDSDTAWYDDFTAPERKYTITGMDYDNGSLHFEMSSQNYMENYGHYHPAGLFANPETFSMDVTFEVGYDAVSAALAECSDDAAVENAYKEQGKMIESIVEDTAILASSAIGPEGPAIVGGLIKTKDGFSSDNVKTLVDKSASTTLDYYYNNCSFDDDWKDRQKKASSIYSSGSNLVFDTYTLLASNGVQEAKDMAEANDYAKLAGSVGKCVVTQNGETTTYATVNVGLYTPGYTNTYKEIMTSPGTDGMHGLAALCGWDADTAYAIKQEIDSHTEFTDDQKTDMKNLVTGGYVIDENTSYSQLYDYLDTINTDYESVKQDSTVDAVPGVTVFEGWNSGVNALR